MEPSIPNPINTTQMANAQKTFILENQMKSGVAWFFWIAALSMLNSIIYLVGGSLTFIVGLGATQVIDGITSAFAKEFTSGSAGTIIGVIGFGLDLLIAGFFVLCGVLGRKRFRWIVVIGMVFYALDGLIFLAVGEWLPILFHAYALWGLWRGLKAINELAALERINPPAIG